MYKTSIAFCQPKWQFVPKLLLIMKLVIMLLTVAILQARATGFAQNVTINVKRASVAEIISQIQKQTGYDFLYNSAHLEGTNLINLNLNNAPIKTVLDGCLKDQALTYEIENKTVLIHKKIKTVEKVSTAENQQREIKGRVIDKRGEPLEAVMVAVKGSTSGVMTDKNGEYRINLRNENKVLVFNMFGYIRQEKEVPLEGNTLNVTLEELISNLEEVVVVGYGAQRRQDVTGSISSVSGADIENLVITSADQALQGQAAGVQMTQTSSAPGGNASVRIRGGNSISAGNEPLYVIDGFPIYNDNGQYATGALSNGQPGNVLASLSPNDIASMEILKDASATAIYGSRGANGVVIITTKRGKSGQSTVNFETYYGIQEVARKLPLINNAIEYATLYNEQQRNLGRVEPFPDPQALGEGGTDWQDAAFKTAPIQSYQLNFSGGDDKTKYYISGNYFNQEGVVIGSDFQRGSIRVNLDRDVSSKFKIGTSINATRMVGNQVKTDTDPGSNLRIGSISSIINATPTEAVYNADGTYNRFFGPDGGFYINPIASLLEVVNQSRTNRIVGNAFGEYQILDGLTARVSIGGDQINVKEDFYQPAFIQEDGTDAVAKMGFVQSFSWLNENTLTYKKVIDNHSFNSMVGFTRQAFKTESAQTGSQRFVNDILGNNSLGSGALTLPPLSSVTDWALESYIGRINYGFKSKYLITLTGRIDGSSRFGENNKYSFFPSGSLAWRVSQEDFMKNQSTISDLKLRLSYGRTGNQEIPQYRSLASLGNSNYPLGTTINSGITPVRVSNPDLRWESTDQFNFGIDAGFLSGRLSLTADYYDKRTTDLLLDVVIPGNSGFVSALRNIGSVKNHGVEFALNTVNVNREFTWKTSFNIAFNRNEILDLGGENDRFVGQASEASQMPTSGILRVGEPVGAFYGYVTDGLFQSQQEINESAQPTAVLGDRRYKDLDEDGEITANDRKILGYAQPDFFYGFTNNFSYKGIDLSVFFQGVQGNSVLNLAVNRETNNNVSEARERWSVNNTNTDIPIKLVENRITDKRVEDGSFLRLRNITLGYNLPKSLVSSVRLRSARIHVNAQNLLTFTNYSGYDPEVSSFGQDNLSAGVDRGGYPIARTFTFGINIGL